jgi:hypothetical protein
MGDLEVGAHVVLARVKRTRPDGIAIPQQSTRRSVVRKGLDDLMRRPSSCGMFSDRQVDCASRAIPSSRPTSNRRCRPDSATKKQYVRVVSVAPWLGGSDYEPSKDGRGLLQVLKQDRRRFRRRSAEGLRASSGRAPRKISWRQAKRLRFAKVMRPYWDSLGMTRKTACQSRCVRSERFTASSRLTRERRSPLARSQVNVSARSSRS